ncbi:MAG TPA: hypothetical protein VFZ38_19355 [Vicinamibacterales bacterium]
MAKMMILNPRRRGAKKRKPSAAQLAARAKFIAAAKARRAKLNPKRRRKSKRRAAPKLNPVTPMKRSRKSSRRRRSPLRFFRRKARRNPILPRSFMDTHLQPAMIGAAGAVLNDIAVGRVVKMLPASLQKQEIRHLVKGVSAIGLSMLAAKAKVASSATVKAATVGALTCVLHDAARAQVQKAMPSIALGEYLSEVMGPWDGMESYQGQIGEYLSSTDSIGASDVYEGAEFVS